MIEALLPQSLSGAAFVLLLAVSFGSSFLTAALGIGGGVLMLGVLAMTLPPAALIPVHGLVQLGSNAGRAALFLRHLHQPALPGFLAGTLAGCALGGLVVVDLPPGVVQAGVGLFVLWSVLARPPRWLVGAGWLAGGVSSVLTMFFGATGPFVATWVKSLSLPRHAHVATHAALMTVQHGVKTLVFGLLGFAFGPWMVVIAALILAGLAGSWAGRLFLNRISDLSFGRALNVVLVLIALRLIWQGLA